jgi:23S rRNA pseudouridine1911/1915/1917 synthase
MSMSANKLPAPVNKGPLLPWLLDALKPMSRTKIKDLLRHGQVLVNGRPVTQHDQAIGPTDRIAIARERAAVSAHGLKQSGIVIVFEDDALIVIDKPPGLLSVSRDDKQTNTAHVHLCADLQARAAGRAFVVHRLDRDTSGLLMFARSETIRDSLKANWPNVMKTYLAVVEGVPAKTEGVIESYLAERRDLRVRSYSADRVGAKRAVSHFRVVQVQGAVSLLEVRLDTGRKHQIRVHLAGLGCPVVGDSDYGAKSIPAKRLGLHAWRLAFDHPVSGRRIELESAFPTALQRILDGPRRRSSATRD